MRYRIAILFSCVECVNNLGLGIGRFRFVAE